ncbi:MAG: hypothetical protein MNPFHGCM_02268 [Gemmatimonadaceae bacterium]|nr:hypothetical protein [Gemmatimonadaceae bacterium]
MVVVLFAERHSDDIAWLAVGLAHGFVQTGGNPRVALALDDMSDLVVSSLVLTVDIASLSPREASRRLRELAGKGYQVVSASSGRNERALAFLDAADRILLVADLSVPSVRGLQRTIKLVDSLGLPPDRTPVVLYRCRDDAALSPSEVAGVLSRDVFAQLQSGVDGPADAAACAALADRLLQLT